VWNKVISNCIKITQQRNYQRPKMGGQRHALSALLPGNRPGTHCTEYCLGLRADLDVRKISPPLVYDCQTVQPVASRYPGVLLPRKAAPYRTRSLLSRALNTTLSPWFSCCHFVHTDFGSDNHMISSANDKHLGLVFLKMEELKWNLMWFCPHHTSSSFLSLISLALLL
jgi:hypothetical protein